MERLISQARKGDPDAFTALMESQMQNMYKAARSVLCNDEDIADAISDTILVCWEKLSQLKEDRYFRTWTSASISAVPLGGHADPPNTRHNGRS